MATRKNSTSASAPASSKKKNDVTPDVTGATTLLDAVVERTQALGAPAKPAVPIAPEPNNAASSTASAPAAAAVEDAVVPIETPAPALDAAPKKDEWYEERKGEIENIACVVNRHYATGYRCAFADAKPEPIWIDPELTTFDAIVTKLTQRVQAHVKGTKDSKAPKAIVATPSAGKGAPAPVGA